MTENLDRRHISTQFEAELETVRQQLLGMASLASSQYDLAVRSMLEGDETLARRAIDHDVRIDRLEVSIDDECARILARRQPAAGDLRQVYAIVKTVTHLERIGDEAERIARLVLNRHAHDGEGERARIVGPLALLVRQIITAASEALERNDSVLAGEAVNRDRDVDREHERLMQWCMTTMTGHPRAIRRTLDVVWTVRALERIGDHARHVAEYVIYRVDGRDVRHRPGEEHPTPDHSRPATT